MKLIKHFPEMTVEFESEKEMLVIDGRLWTVKEVKEMIMDSLISTKHAYEDLLKEIDK